MAYKPISRKLTDIKGYTPRYSSTITEEEPVTVASPIIIDDPEVEDEVEDEDIAKEIPEETPEEEVTKPSIRRFTSKAEFKSTMLPIYSKLLASMGLNTAYAKSLVAQDALESAWGSRPSGRFNFGGIKGKGTVARTREVINGKNVYINDSFRDFESLEDYAKYKINLLNNNRYKAFAGDISQFADRVARGGYATDPQYASVLNRVIQSVRQGGIIKAQQGAELKPDNRNWIQRQIDKLSTKYRSSQWANSAPAQVVADFSPLGLVHYTLLGKPDTAKLAILPGAAGTKNITKSAEQGLKTVYEHYGDDLSKYFMGALENLRNPDVVLTPAERLKVPKRITSIESSNTLKHDYAFFTNNTGNTTLKISTTASDPVYVGEKAAAKQFLQELVGTTSPAGIKDLTLSEKELFTPRYVYNSTIPMSTKDIYSRLIAYKAEGKIPSSFEKLTDQEAKKLFDIAYDRNMFASNTTRDEFWNSHKDELTNIFKKVPAIVAGTVIGKNSTSNEN